MVAITGPSGSGKSTMLGLLAGLDAPSDGSVTLDGVNITALDEDGLARLRGQRIGFVFQFFHLLPSLTALENVLVPMEIAGVKGAAARAATVSAVAGVETARAAVGRARTAAVASVPTRRERSEAREERGWSMTASLCRHRRRTGR